MKNILLFYCVCTFLPTIVLAGNNPLTLAAVRTPTPPVIDGYGNDAVWKSANSASGFLQRDPEEGSPATEQTEVKLLFDDENIYLFAMMYDSSPDKIVARLSRRDENTESDFFAFGFDSYNDQQTAFIFLVTPSGSKFDAINFDDGRSEDASWDPVWECRTRILENGWSAEISIPLSQIRFAEGNDVWGINFVRKISRSQEETHWALMKKGTDGLASLTGSLTGMAGVKLPILFEVLPYAVASSEHYPRTAQKEKVERLKPNFGVDIKYGVSSNFTIDATFNPDFAQVEADPAILNLTTFETFYPEKRPFFIEGTQILRFVTFGGDFGPGLFYSRRIGKAIDVNLPSDGTLITDAPQSATILGAAKFSGKTESGTSIGVLTALTDEEQYSYRDTVGAIRTVRAEPMASYNLVRVKQDLYSNSNIGGILTATARDGSSPAYTAGADWDIKFGENEYRFNGFLAHSRVINASGDLREGNAGKANFGKISGNWVYSINSDFTSRRYYINDLGFFRSPNDYGLSGQVAYREFQPGTFFRSYNYYFNPHLRWNFDGLTLFRQVQAGGTAQFLNYWSIEGSTQYSLEAKDPFESRGHGIYISPASYFLRAELVSDYREPVIVEVEENYRKNTDGAVINNVEGAVVVRPTSAMEYKISLGYATDRDLSSYADAVTIGGATRAVFGKRDIDRTDLTIRSSILFSNELSLQLYNQFFWAKGRYQNFTLLQSDGTLTSYAYTGNADFNATSLISNVVLRWEYREGSTFYFVWSHTRAFRDAIPLFSSTLSSNLENTFLRTAPDNTYVVKLSYWMTL